MGRCRQCVGSRSEEAPVPGGPRMTTTRRARDAHRSAEADIAAIARDRPHRRRDRRAARNGPATRRPSGNSRREPGAAVAPRARGAGNRPATRPIRAAHQRARGRRLPPGDVRVPSLEQKLRVAYLGPAGTFSHAAVRAHFGDFVDAVPCPTIDEVVRAAEAGRSTTPWCPWRTPPKARWAARSTSCAPPSCDVRRGEAAHPPEPDVAGRRAGRGAQGLFALAVAGPVRAVARAAPAAGAAGGGGEQRGGRAARVHGDGAAAIAGDLAASSMACRSSRRTSRTSPTTPRASGSSDGRRFRRRDATRPRW